MRWNGYIAESMQLLLMLILILSMFNEYRLTTIVCGMKHDPAIYPKEKYSNDKLELF